MTTHQLPASIIERFHFSVRFKSLFFPIDIRQLTRAAREADYLVDEEKLPIAPTGVRIQVDGIIGRREDLRLYVDGNRGVISVQGTDIEPVLQDFEQVTRSLEEQARIDLSDEARFYEFIASLEVDAGRSPIEAIQLLFRDSIHMRDLESRMGHSVASFGVRLVASGESPTEDEWSDYRIEPLVARPTRAYSIVAVHRSTTKQEVAREATGLREKVEDIVRWLDSLGPAAS